MDRAYLKLVNCCCSLVVLYIFTSNSYPLMPENSTRFSILLISSCYILFIGYRFHKENRYFPTMFAWSLALMPWAFFLEMRILFGSFTIDMIKYEDKYSHSIVVYNSFRYVLLIFVTYIVLKDLVKTLKNLN